MVGGVAVLELEDIGKEHDRAAVSAIELKRRSVPLLPLPRKRLKEGDQGSDDDEGECILDGRDCDDEPQRRKRDRTYRGVEVATSMLLDRKVGQESVAG